VFAWTDEWHRAGHDVNDWDFGLVDRSREPKPALELARAAFAAAPFGTKDDWPRVSVIVCARNGARVIGDCISALRGLDYPDYETIVVDDGSSDRTAEIASVRGARVITTSGVGLSAARNIGIDASDGVIVAFCDDDCRPERDWLRYLVRTFSSGAHVGVGGPNLPPPAGVVGDSVAQAPGGPTHVLLSPTLAEHIPGCNMAFRRSALDAVGCFDPQFHTAGDDVDICWRLLDAGGTLGFSPAAMVWHEPRSTVRGYARQQLGYGRAEALLERKWPDRYNGVGHLDWSGATHGGRTRRSLWRSRWRVYHGPTGTSPFQSVYSRPVGTGALFPLAPERYFLLAALAVATLFQVVGQPVLPRVPGLGVPLAVLLLAACAASMVAQAMLWSTSLVLDRSLPRRRRLTLRVLVFWLCLLQPLTRMYGRTHQGLTPWRHRGPRTPAVPRSRTVSAWSESWMAPELWAERLANRLSGAGAQVLRGSDFDTWDLQVRVGPLAAARVRLAIEEHGEGRQMLRFKVWPRIHLEPMAGVAVVGTSAGYALTTHSLISGAMLAIAATWLGARIASQAAAASVLPTHLASKLPDRVRS
jgi:glycosyltransferase involved in cell wall biosynthesis